jgi:ABC-2 type transport system permease protein
MREARALVRAAWFTAASYRVGMIMSVLGLAAVLLPLYFIANALQATMQPAITPEARQYFAFVAIGAAVFSLISTCTTALPSALDGAIARGTFEVMLGTPARLRAICAGLIGYQLLWALLRAAILLAAAALLGANFVWHGVPGGVAVLTLTMLSYVGVGLFLSALVLVFRTTGPLAAGFLTASMFLGGVYYPTHVIPSWIRDLAGVFPLTYGLRAIRKLVLLGAPIVTVARDLETLTAITALSVSLGTICFYGALRYARRAGTLSSY